MVARPLPDDWPAPPDEHLDPRLSDLVARGRQTTADLIESPWLAGLRMTLCDSRDQFWRTRVLFEDQQPVFHPFAKKETDERPPYRWCIHLRLSPGVAVSTIRRIYESFPEIQLHLPAMILERNSCYSPSHDTPLEVAAALTF